MGEVMALSSSKIEMLIFEENFQELSFIIYSSWYPESSLKGFWDSTSTLFMVILLALQKYLLSLT